MDGDRLRKVMLEVLAEQEAQRPGSLQSGTVLQQVGLRLNVGRSIELQQAILTYWHDLVCSGQIAWGRDFDNAQPPWCHLTERGRKTLRHLSRDPMNPDGYMEYLAQHVSIGPVAGSYIEEALKTYGASCYKATAVMVGAAAERLLLDLAEELSRRLQTAGRPVPKGLSDWRVKTVFEAVTKALEAHRGSMPAKLAEPFAAYWPAFVQQIRAGRNEAGHPASVAPVTPELVHAALLTFPELARIVAELKKWLATASL